MSYNSKITSFEDACSYLGEDPKALPIVDHLPADRQRQILADYKLPVIAKALNKEANNGQIWVPDYSDSDQYKYWPVFYWEDDISGFRFDDTYYDWSVTYSNVGPRLSLISEEVSDYFGKQFIELHRDKLSMDEMERPKAKTSPAVQTSCSKVMKAVDINERSPEPYKFVLIEHEDGEQFFARLTEYGWNYQGYGGHIPKNDNLRIKYWYENTDMVPNDFVEASKPLMIYLSKNHNPHCTAIVSSTLAEVLEGVLCTGEITEHIQD